MAVFKIDSQDTYFNLFEMLKVQDGSGDFEENDLKQIFDEYAKFCENEIYPTRQKSDHDGVKHLPQKGVVVSECLHRLNQLYYEKGWFALGLNENIGGIPTPYSVTMACISIGTASNAAWMMYPGLSRAALNMLLHTCPPQYKDFVIPRMISGEYGGTMCLTESGAGSDVGALKTVATPLGNGSPFYKMKGVKIFISCGENDLYQNIIHLVLARTPGAPAGTKGISLFAVPRNKINADGTQGAFNDVICTKIEEKMGIHASATCELTFGLNDQCEGLLVGKEFDGMANMFLMMNEARLLCGIQGESQSNLAFVLTEQYAKERAQFGQEIIKHPDVERMLLKMRAMGRGLRALCLMTADLIDKMHRGSQESKAAVELLTPICKAYGSDEGFNVCIDAVQVHGGYGYCQEFGIEQFVRDGKIATIYEGANGIQAIDFVMRKIFRDQGETLKTLALKIRQDVVQWEKLGWQKEGKMFMESLMSLEQILKKFTLYSQKGEIKEVLTHCTDFLKFCGHLFVGHSLGQHAARASELLTTKNSAGNNLEEVNYLKSKVVDFKIFCQNYLVQNKSLSEMILNFQYRSYGAADIN